MIFVIMVLIALAMYRLVAAAGAADDTFAPIWNKYLEERNDRIQAIQDKKEISRTAVSAVCLDGSTGTNGAMDTSPGPEQGR